MNFSYYHPREENLHHGQFLFRHKGKKKKGKPNYPPTKLLVQCGRRWRRPLRGMRKVWNQEDKDRRRQRKLLTGVTRPRRWW